MASKFSVRKFQSEDQIETMEAMLYCYCLKDWWWPNAKGSFFHLNPFMVCSISVGGLVGSCTVSLSMGIVTFASIICLMFLGILHYLHRWPERMKDLQNIKDHYSKNNDAFWVATANDNNKEKIIGAVAVRTTFSSPTYGHQKESQDTAELKRMFVIQEFRGLGVAKLLMDTLTDHLKGLGYKRVFLLSSIAQEAAHKSYLRYGFIQSTTFLAPIQYGSIRVKELLLEF
jgi:GNAT superfamily N-acetyltransferase